MNIDPIKVARFFATVKHAGQLYSGLPYTHHLMAVEEVLRRFGELTDGDYMEPEEPEDMLVAAWLHDCMEDCGVKAKEIAEMFGDEVAALVSAVTDETGESRKIRKALTYPKIRAGGSHAVRLKLADRIANLEHGGAISSMYKKEADDFRRALYTPGENEDMWDHVEELLAK